MQERGDIFLRILASILIVLILFCGVRLALSCSKYIVTYNGEERIVRATYRYMDEKEPGVSVERIRIMKDREEEKLYVRVECKKNKKKYVDWICFERKWLCFYKLKGIERKTSVAT